jgi:tetratricopeptide (TPR) repeat protein
MEKTDILASLYQNLSITHALKGEHKKSREYAYKHTEIFGEEIPLIIIGIGDSFWREGELEKGLEYMEKGIERVREQLENPDEHQLILFNTANLLLRKGEIQKALDKYKKCIEISTNKKVRDQPWFYFDIGMASCYLYKGELNEALEYAQEALEKCEKISYKYGLGWVHYLLARIYYEKNEIMKALVHSQSSLDYRQEIGNKQEMALSLRWIITLLLENHDFEEANSFFEQLKKIAKEIDDLIIDRCFRLSNALILSIKTRPKYWIQAIDILEKFASDKIVDYELTATGLILLCELLLKEFSISGDEEVLKDLQTHTNRVIEIAKKQNIYSMSVEAHNLRILSLWIQAQYSKVDIDIQNARNLLIEAKKLADEKGLVKLAQKISNQYTQLLEQLHNWDEFIKKYYEFIKD